MSRPDILLTQFRSRPTHPQSDSTLQPDSHQRPSLPSAASASVSASGKSHTKPVPSTMNERRGLCTRLSQYLWPTLWGSGCDSASKHAPTPPQPRRHHPDPLDCKACREHKVDCDHTRPQCGHCFQEQLLCFYVNPVTKPRPRPKRKPKDTTDTPQLTTPSITC